jgi:hypothetical protein
MTLRFTLLLLALLAVAAGPARAQYPRLILIEEGTNASCDPCARQDPIFEEFLAKPDVAPFVTTLVYHALWPGPDTMNKRAPEMNDARIRGYYGMFGMPMAVVDGRTYRSATSGLAGSVPADTLALRRLVDSLRGLDSPILVTISDSLDGDRLLVATTVATLDSIAASLRIAVVERHHYYPFPTAGTNGQEHFPWIVRAMLPTHAGRPLVLDSGASVTFADTIAIDPEWNRSELYVVAFVQDDTTHEVLQTATTREQLEIAEISRAQAAPGDTFSLWSMTFATATRGGEFIVGIESDLPGGWTADVVVGSVDVADGDTVALDGDIATSIGVVIRPTIGSGGKGVVRVSLTGERGATDTVEYRLYAGELGIPVLQWHSRFTPEVAAHVAAALDRTEHDYILVPREDVELFTLSDFPLIMVAAGDDTLDAAQRSLLRTYLDARGRLLISGSQIAQSLGDLEYDETGIPRDTAFLHNYLHASYIAPTSASLAVNGVRNDPIAANVGFILDGGRRSPGTPDRIRPRRNALPVFYYGSSRDSVGAIRFGRPEHRVVYIAFGVEAIADTSLRATVLGRSIDWLLGDQITTGIAESIAESASIVVTPSPARSTASVEVQLSQRATLRVVDLLGRTVSSMSLSAGRQHVTLDLSMLAPGPYLVVVDEGLGRRSARLIVE